MRLLHTSKLTLETFMGVRVPPYAILSHTWGEGEVLFEDIQGASSKRWAKIAGPKWKRKPGGPKILDAVKKAFDDRFEYIWIDTCCINKDSSSELSEAINSMYRWYQESRVCYAYLSDVYSSTAMSIEFQTSRWFERGWTGNLTYAQLQELIAPPDVQFFNATWGKIGTRSGLAQIISNVTGIGKYILQQKESITEPSFHTRMRWVNRRRTTRPEDMAYSLMGIFNVNMPLLYGEGEFKAFERLQCEIINGSGDQTFLLHTGKRSILAESPYMFHSAREYQVRPGPRSFEIQLINHDIRTSLLLSPLQHKNVVLGIVNGVFADDPSRLCRPALMLSSNHGQDIFCRHSRAILKVKLNHYDEAEVIDISTGLLIDVIHQDKLQRRTVTLRGRYNGNPMSLTSDDKCLRLRSLVHKTARPLFEYSKRYYSGPKPTFPTHPVYPRKFPSLVAAIYLQNLSNDDSCVVVLMFEQSRKPDHLFEAVPTSSLEPYPRRTIPYVVELEDWVGAGQKDEFNPFDLGSIASNLERLPICRANSSNNRWDFGDFLFENSPMENSKFEFFISTAGGLRFTVSVNPSIFLESTLLFVDIEIAEDVPVAELY
ncbi:heterokaryon incompatibility protein-domain-containing protein [Nemania sp. FL0916]|nr:heterokaryon incompatibility protein-domain-containing protein [Nemania sp. FL0916]